MQEIQIPNTHYTFLGLVSGKSFGKAFRILGLDERKGRWVVKQDFQGYF